ncbi:MAG: porin family protein [Candidatus Saccharicenans sp.]|nr:porin family protein [Candidatus Saccharicenans sp.]
MKKLISSLLLIALLATPGQAFEFKRIIGLLSSSYSSRWPDPVTYGWDSRSSLNPFKEGRVSYFGGIGLEFSLRPKLELELDALYKETGSAFSLETMLFTSYKYEYRISEISIPLLVKYHFLKSPRPYVLAGFDYSFILSHRCQIFEAPEASQVYRETIEADLDLETRKSDLALILGLGFELQLNKRSIGFELRYEPGLLNLYKGWRPPDEPYPVVRSRQFLVVLSYSIK